jgi:hypothetical protein
MSTRLAKLTLALAVVGTPALAAVIDFEGVPSAGNPDRSGTLTVDGFDFTSSLFRIIDSPGICPFGGCVTPEQYIWSSLGTTITMTKSGGGTFSFHGFDVDQAFNDSAAAIFGGFPNASILDVFVIQTTGSASIQFAFDLTPGFQTFDLGDSIGGGLPPQLHDVTAVIFQGLGFIPGEHSPVNAGFALDNIRVDEIPGVPEPGTLLLLGAGLAELGRRRLRLPR